MTTWYVLGKSIQEDTVVVSGTFITYLKKVCEFFKMFCAFFLTIEAKYVQSVLSTSNS